uniref:Chorismate mutase n=1 Tax=Rhizochromulina marina TaxID=1034831 RepID=A0A7S2W8H0_9STRA
MPRRAPAQRWVLALLGLLVVCLVDCGVEGLAAYGRGSMARRSALLGLVSSPGLVASGLPAGALDVAAEAPSVLLLPLVEAREVLVLMKGLLEQPDAWAVLEKALNAPPFTDASLPRVDVNGRGNTPREIPPIGNLFRKATQQYEAQLAYRASGLSRPDETLVRADLDLRDLYRNAFLGDLQDFESEVAFLLRSQKVDAPLPPPASAARDPSITADLRAAYYKTMESLDAYLTTVPSSDLGSCEDTAKQKAVKTLPVT